MANSGQSAKTLVFPLPRSVDATTVNSIFIAFNKLTFPAAPFDFIFDLTACSYLRPAGAIILSALSDEAKAHGGSIRFRIRTDSRLAQFGAALGLFRSAFESATDYESAMRRFSVQITRYRTPRQASKAVESIMKQVVHRTSCTKPTEAAIAFMVTEIVDNARHAYNCYSYDQDLQFPHPLYLCAFSGTQHIEVAIYDRGVGIQASLQQVEKYKDISQEDALRAALERGVSGDPGGSPGFGLFSTAEFIRANSGSMQIWSSRKLLTLTKDNITVDRSNNRGTLIALKINAEIEIPFETIVTTDTVEDLLENWNLQRT